MLLIADMRQNSTDGSDGQDMDGMAGRQTGLSGLERGRIWF